MGFKMDRNGMKKLEKQLSTTVSVPKSGSEAAAAASVRKQYKDATGATMNNAAARKAVKQGRAQ